jgi:hypothetical protein
MPERHVSAGNELKGRQMNPTRRDFLQTSGYVALGAALVSQAAGRATAQDAGEAFDIDAAFSTFMADIGGSAEDGGGAVTFTGSDPILRSHFRIGAVEEVTWVLSFSGAGPRLVSTRSVPHGDTGDCGCCAVASV